MNWLKSKAKSDALSNSATLGCQTELTFKMHFVGILSFCQLFNKIFTLREKEKDWILVCLYWSGYYTLHTHLRNPTTAQRGHFELLDVSSGPFRTSLDNLGTLGSPRVSMLTQSLVRTLVQRVTQCSRTPVLKPSSKSGLPFAWITVPATDTSQQNGLKWDYITLFHKCLFGKTIFSSFSHGKFSSTWIFKNVLEAWVPTWDRVLVLWTIVWGWKSF